MKFKNEHLLAILEEDPLEGYEIVKQGGWIQDGKYQYQEIIFSYRGKNYLIEDQRSGSFFTEWYHPSEYWNGEDIQECPEMKEIEVTTKKWVKA